MAGIGAQALYYSNAENHNEQETFFFFFIFTVVLGNAVFFPGVKMESFPADVTAYISKY
jgi:hypothetical protein